MKISPRGPAASHSPAASWLFGGLTAINMAIWSLLIKKKKNVHTRAHRETFTLPLRLAETDAAPSRKEVFCGFSLSLCSKIHHLFLFSRPLNTTCAGTPAFQLVADVVSARNIRSLSWFPHFNYKATRRAELLVSEGLTGKQNAPRRPLCGRRQTGEGPAVQRQLRSSPLPLYFVVVVVQDAVCRPHYCNLTV